MLLGHSLETVFNPPIPTTNLRHVARHMLGELLERTLRYMQAVDAKLIWTSGRSCYLFYVLEQRRCYCNAFFSTKFTAILAIMPWPLAKNTTAALSTTCSRRVVVPGHVANGFLRLCTFPQSDARGAKHERLLLNIIIYINAVSAPRACQPTNTCYFCPSWLLIFALYQPHFSRKWMYLEFSYMWRGRTLFRSALYCITAIHCKHKSIY